MASSRASSVSASAMACEVGGQPLQDAVEAAGGQDPVASRLLRVAGARVLGQVAQQAGIRHLPGGGRALPGQDLRQGGLAGPVPSDQADAVTGGDLETGGLQQGAGADGHGHIARNNHEGTTLPVLTGSLRTSA
jgi:hypothetical protein